ncbi:hypothetical protein GPECTOR_17g927 [Gonium pectorale]|uniref:Uncharacterized protein n=1 Tax=Gonium pectorale TaxID=33097 RepID=A0A150GKF7_GONPE|nr:hypothetical protein GPECTOR_17g927 [Gonium pectorale]|eukprot:KXZ50288.1 hypothetical protein GPECTOR_17g927 [Gonium pectorale]
MVSATSDLGLLQDVEQHDGSKGQSGAPDEALFRRRGSRERLAALSAGTSRPGSAGSGVAMVPPGVAAAAAEALGALAAAVELRRRHSPTASSAGDGSSRGHSPRSPRRMSPRLALRRMPSPRVHPSPDGTPQRGNSPPDGYNPRRPSSAAAAVVAAVADDGRSSLPAAQAERQEQRRLHPDSLTAPPPSPVPHSQPQPHSVVAGHTLRLGRHLRAATARQSSFTRSLAVIGRTASDSRNDSGASARQAELLSHAAEGAPTGPDPGGVVSLPGSVADAERCASAPSRLSASADEAMLAEMGIVPPEGDEYRDCAEDGSLPTETVDGGDGTRGELVCTSRVAWSSFLHCETDSEGLAGHGGSAADGSGAQPPTAPKAGGDEDEGARPRAQGANSTTEDTGGSCSESGEDLSAAAEPIQVAPARPRRMAAAGVQIPADEASATGPPAACPAADAPSGSGSDATAATAAGAGTVIEAALRRGRRTYGAAGGGAIALSAISHGRAAAARARRRQLLQNMLAAANNSTAGAAGEGRQQPAAAPHHALHTYGLLQRTSGSGRAVAARPPRDSVAASAAPPPPPEVLLVDDAAIGTCAHLAGLTLLFRVRWRQLPGRFGDMPYCSWVPLDQLPPGDGQEALRRFMTGPRWRRFKATSQYAQFAREYRDRIPRLMPIWEAEEEGSGTSRELREVEEVDEGTE